MLLNSEKVFHFDYNFRAYFFMSNNFEISSKITDDNYLRVLKGNHNYLTLFPRNGVKLNHVYSSFPLFIVMIIRLN